MTSEFNIRHPLDPDISSLAEEWHRNPLAALLRADANRAANDDVIQFVGRCPVCQRFKPCPVHPESQS